MIYILIQTLFAKNLLCGWQNGLSQCQKTQYCSAGGVCGKSEDFKTNCQPYSSGTGLCNDDGTCGYINGVHKFCGDGKSCINGVCSTEWNNELGCDVSYSYPGTCGPVIDGTCGMPDNGDIYFCPFFKPYCVLNSLMTGVCSKEKKDQFSCEPNYSAAECIDLSCGSIDGTTEKVCDSRYPYCYFSDGQATGTCSSAKKSKELCSATYSAKGKCANECGTANGQVSKCGTDAPFCYIQKGQSIGFCSSKTISDQSCVAGYSTYGTCKNVCGVWNKQSIKCGIDTPFCFISNPKSPGICGSNEQYKKNCNEIYSAPGSCAQ
eukprot:NODE_573_length_5876_cov_0.470833.p2 type:complete len:320 gc:universal NODE_573_length_5876_cov_0.470833:5062-4103(-)